MKNNPFYYAKILLFGEYGIINDAQGLSIPYNYYQGAFKKKRQPDAESQRSNQSLRDFTRHLRQLQDSGELLAHLDLDHLEEDLNDGLYFDSSIPEGYGVGSSGALCAAIYDHYSQDKIAATEAPSSDTIQLLKRTLGQMEAYFHGRSSGLDPLICYLKLPVHIQGKDQLGTVAIPETNSGKGAIFLINSGQPGETQPMVNIFMEKMKQEGFRTVMKEQFNKYNDACIQDFLKGRTQPLFQNLKKLSHLVLENFTPMIPLSVQELWQKGIDTNTFYLKLCGSGGGGFVLGFAPDYEKAKPYLAGQHTEVIYRL